VGIQVEINNYDCIIADIPLILIGFLKDSWRHCSLTELFFSFRGHYFEMAASFSLISAVSERLILLFHFEPF
jgi:hypothetical protein